MARGPFRGMGAARDARLNCAQPRKPATAPESPERPIENKEPSSPPTSFLADRSLSDNNANANAPPASSPNAPARAASYSSFSMSQNSEMQNGTVAHNTVARSPVKEQNSEDTPEWRRRLVNGEVGYGNQTDLFGPTGLENIFQKPAGAASEDSAPPKRRLGLLKGLAAVPSSPPPWPAVQQSDAAEEQAQEQEHGQSQGQGQGLEANKDEKADVTNLEDSLRDETTQEHETWRDSQGLAPPHETMRTASGQIEYENENFSPIYLTMTANMNLGQSAQQPQNFRGSELANRLRQIGTPPSNHSQTVQEESALSFTRGDSSFARLQDESLPEGLPAGTPDMADVGRHVELRRGGYSRDGSFHRRPLSPSPDRKAASQSSNRDPKLHLNTSAKQSPQDRVIDPSTPRQRLENFLSPDRAKSSGSPLKLFDAHDTFTSNRIQRRLSQLEYKSEKGTSSVKETAAEATKPLPKQSRLTSVEERSMQNLDQDLPVRDRQPSAYRVGSFGQGQLNQYQFSGDFSAISSDDDWDPREDSAPDESPSTDIAPPGSRQPFKFQLDESPVPRQPSKNRRNTSGFSASSMRNVSRPKFVPHRKASVPKPEEDPEEVHEYAEGKRGPTSPFKNPTPKRRRTICSVEDEDDDDGDVFSDIAAGTAQRSHEAIQLVLGRKRSDGLDTPAIKIADSETLARRHILRPRNPTPSQRRREEIQAEIMEATEAFIMSSPKLNTIREQLEPSMISGADFEKTRAKAVANEIAAFSMKRQHGVRDKTRKRSVTTQDFLDEALKIMDFIRTKGRPTSGLGSLEETEAESAFIDDANENPSSLLTLERPPSREDGTSTWKETHRQELDPDIKSHLQKYQENDNDTFLNSSMNSIRFSRFKEPDTPEGPSVIVQQDDVRITENPNRFYGDDEEDNRPTSRPQTARTHLSTGSSINHTIVTNASRRSEHVANLAPEAIAHLIPQEVAGMSFDRDKNIWVRQKSPSKEHRVQREEPSGMNESEDDPFGNIPDLTVEDVHAQDTRADSPVKLQPTAETIVDDTEKATEEEEERPVTRDGNGVAYTDTSSAPSKASNFGWSYPKTDTRATSWSTQVPRHYSTQKSANTHATYAIPESEEDDIEHEIQYFEGRGPSRPTTQHPRVRDITISIAEREAPNLEHRSESTPQKPRQNQWGPSSAQKRSEKKQSAWEQSNRNRALSHGRPNRLPVFNGDGDLSLLDDGPARNYRMQLSMNVAGPPFRDNGRDALIAASSSPVKGDVTFMLSDLPDFTLNQIDEFDLPDRVIVKHDGSRFSKALEDRYAQGTAELVKALQDVEPDEPYWEDLRTVNLRKKDLTTLHRLDQLCYQLEELDVSNNKINQVEGIPYCMRRLQVQNNCLTGLTSWTNLVNLQHLDISGNQIEGLDGLAELVHLRVLKADSNKIKSLNGILHLDGLMELSAGGNEIDTVDFAKTNLKSLTDLDLRKNRMLEVRNLHCLPQLQHLNLDDNEIEEFPLVDTPVKPCKFLRSIRLCRNGTTHLDVDHYFPKLESLYIDGNSLTQVLGLEHLRNLRTFSAREQILESESDMEICANNLVKNPEVRNLYLSLNPTYGMQISQHLLSLQRLELASMGLKELPSNFGQLTPNIRSINLNFNSITDLRPLLNIKRLSELLLASNKLERLRANAMVLGKLNTLTKLDWRDNPLTLRFYAPASENRIMSLRRKPEEEQLMNRFALPNGEVEADVQHLLRLDYETRIRRRVTEMMLANLCKNLKELDGLPFDKARVLVKDDVWERLLFLGVIQRKRADTAVDDSE
ncbi:leucine-rich repeat-containing protein 23 protein [Stemphylium lycopersici]|nr:leucine-rich repeat-containing protein 23 protein [Stemphylium lycopersici]